MFFKNLKKKMLLVIAFCISCEIYASNDYSTYSIHELNYELTHASYQGDTSEVKKLLESKANANGSPLHYDTPPLINAAYRGHEDIVKILLEAKANPTSRGYDGLLGAVSGGHWGIAEMLLKAKANLNNPSEDSINDYMASRDSLEKAVFGGRTKIVKMLLDALDAKVAVDSVKGKTLLKTVSEGNGEIVSMLLKAKANPNTAPCLEYSLLVEAASKGHENIVKMLLEAKANPNAWNIYNINPLIKATEKGHDGVVAALLNANGDLDTKHNGIDIIDTVFSIAVSRGHEGIVSILLEAKKVDPKTVLIEATVKGLGGIVSELLNANVDPNTTIWKGNTLLIAEAASRGHEGIVISLLNARANPNAKNIRGNTAFMLAAYKGHNSVIKAMLNKLNTKDITSLYDAKNIFEQSALDQAIKAGKKSTAELIQRSYIAHFLALNLYSYLEHGSTLTLANHSLFDRNLLRLIFSYMHKTPQT